jgi:hypothetical protein
VSVKEENPVKAVKILKLCVALQYFVLLLMVLKLWWVYISAWVIGVEKITFVVCFASGRVKLIRLIQ